MLPPSAILRLPYDASLTLAGIEYAKKSLHYTYNRMRLGTAARLRKIVAGVAVELAFQHWLDANGVPYDRLGTTAFTERDRYDLRLGGRRCDLKSFLLSDRAKISLLRRDPAWLLDAAALVPEDQFTGASLDENDFYLFGFLAGLETRHSADLQKVIEADQDMYLLHTPAQTKWRGDRDWRSLGQLALKSNSQNPLAVEVGGQNAGREAIRERLRLEPRTRAVTRHEFFSLLYLHATRLPGGTVGVHSGALNETHLVAPGDWANIWVYGMEVFIAGWLTKAEFRARCRKLPKGSAVKQYPRTQTDNRAVHVRDLRPIEALVAAVKKSEWGQRT
jgi:hypothetical protein